MILAIDTGGTYIKWAVADSYKLLKHGKISTPYGIKEDWFSAVGEILDINREYRIEGIAISFPGSIDADRGYIRHGGALQYMNDTDITNEILARFSLPCSVENDAACAALAECGMGNLKGVESGVLIVIGTGVGSAIVYHDEIIHGYHGAGGELSLILPGNFTKDTVFNNIGNSLGMRGFTRKIRKEMHDESLNGEGFMQMIREGNTKAIRLFDEYMDQFAVLLFNLQTIFDPQRYVIGGGISADPLYLDELKNHVQKIYDAFPYPLKHAEIHPCRFSAQANLIGALVHYNRIHNRSQ